MERVGRCVMRMQGTKESVSGGKSRAIAGQWARRYEHDKQFTRKSTIYQLLHIVCLFSTNSKVWFGRTQDRRSKPQRDDGVTRCLCVRRFVPTGGCACAPSRPIAGSLGDVTIEQCPRRYKICPCYKLAAVPRWQACSSSYHAIACATRLKSSALYLLLVISPYTTLFCASLLHHRTRDNQITASPPPPPPP